MFYKHMLMEFLLQKLSVRVFCHDRKGSLMLDFLLAIKDFKEKIDSMDAAEQDMTLNEFAVLQLRVMKLYYVLMKSTWGNFGFVCNIDLCRRKFDPSFGFSEICSKFFHSLLVKVANLLPMLSTGIPEETLRISWVRGHNGHVTTHILGTAYIEN